MNNMPNTQEMTQLNYVVGETKTAQCPSCGTSSEFVSCGTQEWPPHIAAAAGLPEVMMVWACQTCHTTLLEPNLTFDES